MSKRKRHSKPKTSPTPHQPVNLMVGDSVVVRQGVKDPDFGDDLSGMQGRVSEIHDKDDDDAVVVFQFDSISLRTIPASTIRRSEEKGLDWTSMGLGLDDIEPAEPRDTQADVDAVIAALSDEHYWDHLGKQGQRIQQVVRGVPAEDDLAGFTAWLKALRVAMRLPFKAIYEPQDPYGALPIGERVTVWGFAGIDPDDGVLVQGKAGSEEVTLPLSDLTAASKKSINYSLIDDYINWVENR